MDLYLPGGDILRYTATTVARLAPDGVTVVDGPRAHTPREAAFWEDREAQLAAAAVVDGEPPEVEDAARRKALRNLNTELVILRNAALDRRSQAVNATDVQELAYVVRDLATGVAQLTDNVRSIVKYLIRD